MFFAGKSPKEDYKSTDYKYHLFKNSYIAPFPETKNEKLMQAAVELLWNRLLLLAVMLLIFLLIISQFAGGWNSSPQQPLGDIILRTSPPDGVAIELTDAQLAELEDAYEHGFENLEPDDPCKRLQLLSYKKLSTWRRQFSKRGFTMDKVRDMLSNGRRVPFTHPEKGVTYTKIFDEQGNWIVVDFVDCIIWQVAPYNFK